MNQSCRYRFNLLVKEADARSGQKPELLHNGIAVSPFPDNAATFLICLLICSRPYLTKEQLEDWQNRNEVSLSDAEALYPENTGSSPPS